MTVNTVDPAYMTATEWADAMVISLEQFGNLPRLDDEEEWRWWGEQVLNLPQISGSIVPSPWGFDTWQEWAMRLNEGLTAVM